MRRQPNGGLQGSGPSGHGAVWADRCARIQCRCLSAGFVSGCERGRPRPSYRCQYQGNLEHRTGGAAGHGGSTQRPHRHHELGDRLYGRRSGRGGICPQQGGADRADQGTGQGVCQRRHLCQRHLPGLCRYTDGPEHRSAVQCRRSGFRHTGDRRCDPAGTFGHTGGSRGACSVLRQ